MKRFASHYLHIPSYGFFKQYVVEIDCNGYIASLYPLKEEAESIIWIPGVISLFRESDLKEGREAYTEYFEQDQVETEFPQAYCKIDVPYLKAVHFYPFDFNQMRLSQDTTFQVLNSHSF